MLIPLCALGFLVWSSYERARRVEFVTNTDREEAVVDATSPTGYAGGKRWLIVPEHNNRSYQWIAETQQMLAKKEWRVRHIDYENAPFGREVHAASPYRWWLGLLAWCDHSVSGQPLGLAVERAALWADPLLHLLLLLVTTIFVARQFGTYAAALLALGLATLFPFAGSFLPGVPGDNSLTLIFAVWSVLPLLAGAGRATGLAVARKKSEPKIPQGPPDRRRTHRLFALAGCAGGLGLWISASHQTPILAGIAGGAILAAWLASRNTKTKTVDAPPFLPWRTWACSGAATSLVAYLVEYFPSHLDLRLQVNHPLYGLAWIGVGELLGQIESWFRQGNSFGSRRQIMVLVLALVAVTALPVTMARSGAQALFTGDQLASRLSNLPNAAVAKNSATWLVRDGLTGTVAATCLPLLFLAAAAWLLIRRPADRGPRTAIALGAGPVLVALLLAFSQLAQWSLFGAVLLTLLVVMTSALHPADSSPRNRWLWTGFVGLVFLPGLIQLKPPTATAGNVEFTRLEVEGLIERSLAHWLADHAEPDGAVILLPPDRTTSWCFHGGLRGLGSANWENRDGLAATVRIVTATTVSEAQALINQRGITHIVLPSWDSDLDEFARWTLPNPEDAFVAALHHWALPSWLQPLPYKLPSGVGFDGQSVVILKVTDESSQAASLSRLAEYFVETQQNDQAVSVGQSLQRYPTDLAALVALAQVEKACDRPESFTKTYDSLLSSLGGGADRTLPWDRRVSLAIVLAQGGRTDLAREQVRRCLDKIDAARIRSLTTLSLYRLQVLATANGLQITDPTLRERALKLLPVELRQRL
jgi:hypothetical protein